MQFVDTNIFIRHLTRDDPDKAQACFALFQQAERNEVTLTTNEAVIAEVVYVLSSRTLYGLSRGAIRTLLYPLLSLQGLKLTNRRLYLHALDVYAATNLDFEDALIVAHMERLKISDLVSYDRDFDHVPGIVRYEP